MCHQRKQVNNINIDYIQYFLYLAGKRISFVRPFLSPHGNTNFRTGREKYFYFRHYIAKLNCCGDKGITEFIRLEITRAHGCNRVEKKKKKKKKCVVKERCMYPTTPMSRLGCTPCQWRHSVRRPIPNWRHLPVLWAATI